MGSSVTVCHSNVITEFLKTQIICFTLNVLLYSSYLIYFKRFIQLILEREEGREKERENIGCLTHAHAHALTGEQTCNPGTCPDRESNHQPYASQDDTQPTEPHWSRLLNFLKDCSSGFMFFPLLLLPSPSNLFLSPFLLSCVLRVSGISLTNDKSDAIPCFLSFQTPYRN